MEVTLTIPEELANQLDQKTDLAQVLELGLRELAASKALEFSSAKEVIETLASLPTPEQILALRPSREFQERVQVLLEFNDPARVQERNLLIEAGHHPFMQNL